ncbi:molybdopterin synthase catalytic subunit [Pedococcus dokdonensis]|uniref:Molybdopterin synthase catalytic subunit 1 n=1 Tax=Pedococcus dokdonensis TaxID=443156 RepID=A0A1H0L291_9MICO|nr:molybdenum cofactor biosynthesis protein MoaE [Pedococcus dokdonensis]SDO62339.1 molybdopterin synthase catalytic subunit [Pedococcus dokdonensis]
MTDPVGEVPELHEQPVVALSDVRDEPLGVDEVLQAVRHPRCGGIALFVGVVREHDHGADVSALDYSAHPSVTESLAQVCAEVAGRHDVARLAAVHRVGHLEIGDVAVVAAVSAPHRGEAFEACRDLIDTLKGTVPIWKHQLFSDGSDEWVGLP